MESSHEGASAAIEHVGRDDKDQARKDTIQRVLARRQAIGEHHASNAAAARAFPAEAGSLRRRAMRKKQREEAFPRV